LLIAYEKRGMMRPDDAKRKHLLEMSHTGHFGEKHMAFYIQREGYWWPRMRLDITSVISQCNDCRRFNAQTHGFHPARTIHALLPGDHYQIDLAQFVKSVDGYTHCLVLVDVFTGFIVLRPLKTKSAPEVTRTLWEIFCLIGIPRVLQSDNGKEFVNETLSTLNKLIGVPHRFISEYNPRADGKVERAVRTVKMVVMKLLHGATIYWSYHIPFVQYSYNDKIQALTGSTPFALMYGRRPNTTVDYTHDVETSVPMDVAAWKKHRDDIVALLFPSISKRAARRQDTYRQRLDSTRKRLIHDYLTVGTQVMLKDPKYINNHSKAAHEPTYIGPYTIVKVNRHGTYTVRDSLNNVLDRNIPVDQMKVLTHIPSTDNNVADEEYQVEKILNHRVNDQGELMYHVQWKNYPLSDSTWENERQFVDTAIIDQYFRQKSIPSLKDRAAKVKGMNAFKLFEYDRTT
jgi:transposase InsO family protein